MKRLPITILIPLVLAVAITAHAAPYPSPTDWRDENIYQIFTDRFNDGDPSNNNAESSRGAPYAPSNSTGIHGGDFRGIQQKMDYIKSLGATAIWISPIPLNVANSAYHGYGAQDFYTLAPHWGTMTDLSNMVAAAHARGIKVMLDIVCNHSGDMISGDSSAGYPTYKAPPAGYVMHFNNASVQHAPPFNITNAVPPAFTSIFHTNGEIQTFVDPEQILGELSGLDDFATETTYVRTNMMNIYTNWVGLADFDGFRIDTVKHVEHGFWQYWCPQLHQFGASIGKSNFFMFGEAEDGSESLVGSYTGTETGGNFQLDSMLDYPLYYAAINSVFATASGNTQQIENHYNAIAANYDSNAWYRLVTFLDNHDQPRFLSSGNANDNTNRLTVALEFLYTSRGIPCLYYGTEQAFDGTGDPNNREDMFDGQFEQGPSIGDNFNETHPLFRTVAMLNNFRRNYIALRRGTHVNKWNTPGGPGLFAYTRLFETQEVFVVFNTAAPVQIISNRSTTLPSGTILVNLLNTNETITTVGTNIPPVSVPSTTAKIFAPLSQFHPLDPVVVSLSPAHAVTNAATTARIVMQFSMPMDTNSVQAAFSLTPATSGTFSWSAVHDTMTFTPASAGYPTSTTNLVHLGTNATDAVSGNTLYAPFDDYFASGTTTAIDVQPPSVAIGQPINNATVSGTQIVSGTASDNVAVQKVEVSLDNGVWSTASGTTSWSFSLNTANALNGLHTISARATDTSSNISSIASVTIRFVNVPGSYLQRISAGDPVNATDCVNNVWLKDQVYTLGSFGYSGSSATGFVNNVITGVCTNFWRLYQWERYSSGGSFSYLFDCPEGIYEIQLLEAETYWGATGQREFNLFIQGQQVLTNYDIFARAGGKNIPITLVFTAAVTDAELEMDFVPGAADNARASGIQVRKIGDVDSDGDGIPDWWMLAYFNHPTGQSNDNSLASDDADGSGFSNLQDYLAGTDPLDPSTSFRITNISIVGNDVQVTWTTEPNKTNQLESTGTGLGSNATWLSVGPLTIGTGSSTNQTDFGAATNPPVFYRVRLVQ